MTNRRILYGYQVRQGELLIQPEEAAVVRRIVTLYTKGFSYQKIAEILNDDGISYSVEAPAWNKHKVKRLLENLRYAGTDEYPAIIDEDTFLAVQEQIHKKTENRISAQVRPVLQMKDYLQCTCGGRLCRIAGRNRRKDTLYLKCRLCKKQFVLLDADLLEEVSIQLRAYHKSRKTDYQPSSEVVRLANAINRGLEHPDTPEDVVSLILQGVAARYDCCPEPIEDFTNPAEADFKHSCQVVSYITISDKNMITVHFK